MNDLPRVCITLVIPLEREEALVDWLMGQPDEEIEFGLHPIAARGPLVHLQPGEEQVQGFAGRAEVKLVVSRARSARLVAALRALLAGVDGGYWITPVEDFGSFAREAA